MLEPLRIPCYRGGDNAWVQAISRKDCHRKRGDGGFWLVFSRERAVFAAPSRAIRPPALVSMLIRSFLCISTRTEESFSNSFVTSFKRERFILNLETPTCSSLRSHRGVPFRRRSSRSSS